MTDETFTFKNKKKRCRYSRGSKLESIGKHTKRPQLKIFLLKYCKISVAFSLKRIFMVPAVLLYI